MKIAILGYGKEGTSAEKYFRAHHPGIEIAIFDNFQPDQLAQTNLSDFDTVVRSPSVPPLDQHWSSITKLFFNHCPCPIIGVTGTKGKGTTCSIIIALLKALQKKVWLVGNVGTPALDVLDQIKSDDVAVYELSSFQLWDLEKSPHIAVVLKIEPDHLNIHRDFTDYVDAKANIAKHQTTDDTCIYYAPDSESIQVAMQSQGHKVPYPLAISQLTSNLRLYTLFQNLNLPGQHNQENAQAALLAVTNYLQLSLDELIDQHYDLLLKTFQTLQGLPHRLQFLRELNNVVYYDDNFSTNPASTQVALAAFPKTPIILIAGGRDKTNYTDLPELINLFRATPTLQKVILIGESGQELTKRVSDQDWTFTQTLADAVNLAHTEAEKIATPNQKVIVLMSPAAASFDMFENVYDRGQQFQKLIQDLN